MYIQYVIDLAGVPIVKYNGNYGDFTADISVDRSLLISIQPVIYEEEYFTSILTSQF